MAKPSWTCVGCNRQFKLRKIDVHRLIKVEIATVHGANLVSAAYELCPVCQQRIIKAANPTEWTCSDLCSLTEIGSD